MRAISKTITFKELEDTIYEVTRIYRNTLIKLKLIFHAYYELDPIDIKNNDDVYCFVVEQVNSEKMQQTSLFVKVLEDAPLQEKETHCPNNAFDSTSERNHLSTTMLATNVHTVENVAVESIVEKNSTENITPREMVHEINHMN